MDARRPGRCCGIWPTGPFARHARRSRRWLARPGEASRELPLFPSMGCASGAAPAVDLSTCGSTPKGCVIEIDHITPSARRGCRGSARAKVPTCSARTRRLMPRQHWNRRATCRRADSQLRAARPPGPYRKGTFHKHCRAVRRKPMTCLVSLLCDDDGTTGGSGARDLPAGRTPSSKRRRTQPAPGGLPVALPGTPVPRLAGPDHVHAPGGDITDRRHYRQARDG